LFKRAEQSTLVAQAIVDAELRATRAKTAHLREVRLARDAEAAESETDTPPPGISKQRKA
jgi:hypothetical protein